ncbi:arylsulfatase A-like enzyme [Roseivirga ehrenbergii]|uniref:Sulfatase n=1 Tax=Roseivirga ehrenbergii (strain DSM 102268 / JCM 13514 / KCTC 12282 / NCIMB 14502 / KMM 6017) TaxID=279360 RepID=A0A150X715_ROSEK|nr:sulfatase-like hydrolase/transferase [Roseivirga ehrenbergii]KYG74480.1 sulfatase [Roseivirga ehrenbergii]TCL14213.1 arylsulfatase A-like enzyme [Roseivirga ehrenbergii]
MTITKAFRILVVGLVLSICKADTYAQVKQQDSPPNILLIIADDMGLDAMPGFPEGSVKPYMPNLEALMNSGVSFLNFWSAPLCTPTRATILTGKYGVNTGILSVGNRITTKETSLQKYIDEKAPTDYAHAVIGKWHLSNNASNPTDMGVGYYAGILSGTVQSYTSWPLTENGKTSTNTEYTTTKLTDLAIDWLGAQSQPWFLWMAYNAPHTPFHLPPADLHHQGSLSSDTRSIARNPLPYYMAALEAMDTEIGRLLATIPEEERSNTIVIFIGDNGTPNRVAQSPYSRKKAKGTLYQGGVNVPMVVSGKGVTRAGATETALVNSTDLFATIANLTGIENRVINDSQSFVAMFSQANQEGRDVIYTESIEANSAGYAIRNSKFKLIVYANGNEEFYDLENDPYETENLLNRTLSTAEASAKTELKNKALEIRG